MFTPISNNMIWVTFSVILHQIYWSTSENSHHSKKAVNLPCNCYKLVGSMSSKYVREKKERKQTKHIWNHKSPIYHNIYLNSGQSIEYYHVCSVSLLFAKHTSISINLIFPSVCTRVQQRTQDLQMSTLCGYMQRAGTVCHIWWCPSLVEGRVTYSWPYGSSWGPPEVEEFAPEKWCFEVWRRSKPFLLGPKVTVQGAIFVKNLRLPGKLLGKNVA